MKYVKNTLDQFDPNPCNFSYPNLPTSHKDSKNPKAEDQLWSSRSQSPTSSPLRNLYSLATLNTSAHSYTARILENPEKKRKHQRDPILSKKHEDHCNDSR